MLFNILLQITKYLANLLRQFLLHSADLSCLEKRQNRLEVHDSKA